MFILVSVLYDCLQSQVLNLLYQTTISDLVQIAPHDFGKPSAQAVEDNINAKYSNKVSKLSFECKTAVLNLF